MGGPADDLGRLDAFTFPTVPERGVYLAIMRLFTASLMTDLSAQQVVEELAAHEIDISLVRSANGCSGRPMRCSSARTRPGRSVGLRLPALSSACFR
ncbi:hypothetical protein [Micromonospora maris]|uniref:Uncharacterized protein n=1 Tax=Micromonospora maris TaxID=1003110 RepID=A0A9X0HZI5_9ACTN|nr:hypothetical protein [Micromonospora maris]AEB44428.1 hypothetical protein VAB18032_16620 [Micromonospora maris AB-18-032]KUJ43951.1 hypothetical protein ADL17_11910 [Micromonospora maris]